MIVIIIIIIHHPRFIGEEIKLRPMGKSVIPIHTTVSRSSKSRNKISKFSVHVSSIIQWHLESWDNWEASLVLASFRLCPSFPPLCDNKLMATFPLYLWKWHFPGRAGGCYSVSVNLVQDEPSGEIRGWNGEERRMECRRSVIPEKMLFISSHEH